MTLSIVIPTYNEAENIPLLIDRISKLNLDAEIVIVDDNSPDGTADVVKELSKKYNVKLLKREGKQGLSSAVLDGIKIASNDIIAVMDADLQHPPEILPIMYEKIKNHDLVVASRYIEGGRSKLGFVRNIISKGATFLAHLMLPQTRKVKDPMSGYFMLRKSCLNSNLNPVGYKILLEILTKGDYNSVVEVPYVFEPRLHGESKLGFGEILNYIKLLLKLSEYRPLKFAVVGVSGIGVNMGVLYILVAIGFLLSLAGLIAIESSIISNFILNDMWTFRDRKAGSFIKRCLKYHGAVALGGGVNLVTLLSLTSFGLNYMIANLIGIGLGFIANYLGSEVFVWLK